jgi:23S rRNA (guanosine2251-2'-O)-methyltransferase
MTKRKLTIEELHRLDVEQFRRAEKLPVVVVLDNLRSLNNIGSIFRTCDAFRISAIFLCGITATPPHREIHKTALGATESVSWQYFAQTSQAVCELKKDGFKIFSVEQVENSLSIKNFKISNADKTALIFGHEVTGVDQKIIDQSDDCIEIPQFGTKHSLNVSVCAGIVLWEVFLHYAKIS